MIYCANCGTSLPDDALFCSNCGTQTEKEEIAATISEADPIQEQVLAEEQESIQIISTSAPETTTLVEEEPLVEPAFVEAPIILPAIHEENEILDSLLEARNKNEQIIQDNPENHVAEPEEPIITINQPSAPFPTPETLNRVTEEFLAIESNYNSKLKELQDEKDSIDRSYNYPLSVLKEQHLAQIAEKQKAFSEYSFAGPILSQAYIQSISNGKTVAVAKIGSIILGIIIFFSQSWQIGLFAGGIATLIFWQMEVHYLKLVSLLSGAQKNSFSNEAIDYIKKNSSVLRVAIENKAIEERQSIEILRDELERIYQSREKHAKTEYDKKLSVFKKKEAEITAALKGSSDKNINNSKANISKIISQLNEFPETLDHSLVKWSDSSVQKGKDWVASYIRVGVDNVRINLFSAKHTIEVPRLVPFLNLSNLGFYCKNSFEVKEAIRLSHNIIARALLSLPSSKVKLTFIDPLELGGNASPFTPLLREIYGGMVFTQPNDIENQLSILTRSIENVIQRYLQDKFKDIAEYNSITKEVPEPYRLLVVYNFPHGFNDTTANKLLNIVKSGPKAGIHTVLINDMSAKLPYGMGWEAFEGLNIQEISLAKEIDTHKQFSFDGNLPYSEIVDYINKELPNTSVLKVPFTKYIAPQTEWWKDKAHKRYAVPIGRHGTEVQNLKFDNDDDNQALLIGKPGSGKSNLLHVIIANSLWKYSPDQLEIYLIDFKGGVEFTIYADKKIPHIRTIAIESEREFGLSVLDGVERELLKREMEFSKTGVQNIEQYHEKFSEVKMPRLLLIVDEFQEFFAEDDGIKQAVDDKFDRIIRKGRAFGINTLFSSQTLSGNSIKKSTKELIDIRIALMCSDMDATQILDDRNPGARDLTRPGEGIYNPENGKIEGNKKFQAFFIEKDGLNKVIEDVVSFARSNAYRHDKQIIFRGTEKAHMEKENHPLLKMTPVLSPRSLKLWIGEPVAIADDVTAVIRKQGGSNVLVAGYDEHIGLRIMASLLVSIAVQHQPDNAMFYSFNNYNIDSDMVSIPDELFKNIQQKCKSVSNKEVKEILQTIKTEIETRLEAGNSDAPFIYLSFFSFQRGRVFRKEGYSMTEEGQLLSFILKEGPDVGIFSLLQVDTMDNFSKNLDDNLLKEFSQRVASQMNPDNSVKVIGNQKAAKLGNNRAWYYDDNENILIKFKPYELPLYSWIAQLHQKQSTYS
jgi:ABC-type multidrug transport system fused ATPase/permease subunit